jgi:hypothetical protein
MPEHGPSPEARWPIEGVSRLGFLKNFITWLGKFCSIAAETTLVMKTTVP